MSSSHSSLLAARAWWLRALSLASALGAPSSACTLAPVDGSEDSAALPREAWSDDDDPSLLDPSFTYVFDELPSSGHADRLPWPGGYWPTYLDSINYRWAGTDTRSAAAKYGLAFDKAGVEDAISSHFGVDSLSGQKCRWKSDCGKGEACARRRGEKEGRCSDTWTGICHAWAPAALLEREPRKAVTHNGVRFEINDLKALVSIAYTEGVKARFLSLRCNKKGYKQDLGDVGACKDTNAGSFHVAVTNLLGLQGKAFIEDRVYDFEVWNHPVIGYRVTKNKKVSPATANDLLGVGGADYAFNARAVELRRIRIEVTWVNMSPIDVNGALTDDIDDYTYTDTYNYILELDADGEIIGGEWMGGSRKNHPDFLWLPIEKRRAKVAGVIDYDDVAMLLDRAS